LLKLVRTSFSGAGIPAPTLKLHRYASLKQMISRKVQNMNSPSTRGNGLPLAAMACILLAAFTASAEELTLAVANSTCDAMKKVGRMYQQQQDDVALKYICKSSGRLAKGLHGKAIKADIYVSANRKWMDYMVATEEVSPEQIVQPWGNALVVATPLSTNITNFKWEDLASENIESILIGDPGTAPFGRYAKQALVSTDLWPRIRHKIRTKKNITLLAETLAEASPNTVGILFFSNVDNSLRVLQAVDPSWHPPINYYLAPLKTAQSNARVMSLLQFIQGDAARAVFVEEGFKLASPPSPGDHG
jgi:molybdate transport system substrate-binding protein